MRVARAMGTVVMRVAGDETKRQWQRRQERWRRLQWFQASNGNGDEEGDGDGDNGG